VTVEKRRYSHWHSGWAIATRQEATSPPRLLDQQPATIYLSGMGKIFVIRRLITARQSRRRASR
jgi:hypothetical protein